MEKMYHQDMNERKRLLRLLSDSLHSSGLSEEGKLLEKTANSPLREVLDLLSSMEVRVNDADVHRAIALGKRALTSLTYYGDKREVIDKFERQCFWLQGTISKKPE